MRTVSETSAFHRQGDEPMAQKVTAKKNTKKVLSKKAAPASARPAGGGGAKASARKSEPPKSKAPVKKPVAVKAAAPIAPAAKSKAAAKPVVRSGATRSGSNSGVKPEPKLMASAKSAPAVKEIREKKVPSLSKSDLQYFRNLLLERRREILGDMGSMESEAFKGGSNLSNMPIHMADVGTDNFEQEFTLGLIESERQMLRDIQEALIRIDDGTYGVCQGTQKNIPRVRLEAVPWAKYTMEYQGMLEQGKIGRDNGHSADEDSSGGDDDED